MNLHPKSLVAIILAMLLASLSMLAFNIQPVKSTETMINIAADGSIDPPTAPIQRDGNLYKFTDDIFSQIVVKASNIIVDGNDYTLKGSKSGNGLHLVSVENVIVQNTNIQSFTAGMYIESSSGNTIIGNTMTNNAYDAIRLQDSAGNTVSENTIINNYHGIRLHGSSGNSISGNTLTEDYHGIFLQDRSATLSKETL
jgi:parallel beta-helix repeat protein